jgi:hypothetical protein
MERGVSDISPYIEDRSEHARGHAAGTYDEWSVFGRRNGKMRFTLKIDYASGTPKSHINDETACRSECNTRPVD